MKRETASHLGDFVISSKPFEHVDLVLQDFESKEFKSLNERQKIERVNHALYQLIKQAKAPSFLLIPVLHYIDRIVQQGVLEHYSVSSFELWLNQATGVSQEENAQIRSLMMGKRIPREEYQLLFPIGMGKKYPGTHFVTAHSSPDLDTTVASFWGWVDAFAARVAEGLHVWNLPGGPPLSQIEISLLFNQIFGERVFSYLIKTRSALTVSGIDLMTQQGVVKKRTEESTLSIDYEKDRSFVILVDEAGYYLGDWRHFDVEGVRQVIMLLNQCLRWFENDVHVKLVALFGKQKPSLADLSAFVHSVLDIKIAETEPVKDFTFKQERNLQDYLCKVLRVPKGIESTFGELAHAMRAFSIIEFQEFVDLLKALHKTPLFDRAGTLVENRPEIFQFLDTIIQSLNAAVQSIRAFVEKLEIALNVKQEVFGHFPQGISYRADLEEIRSKMGNHSYLTVVSSGEEGRQMPLGIIDAVTLHKPILGTVSLRDFCNREETKIPSYLEVISVIDHHKSALQTLSAPVAFISDAQSSNVLVAELAFQINDRYSAGGMTLEQIRVQMKSLEKEPSSPSRNRIMQRLLQRELAAERRDYFIDPQREFVEYLHFLYAIFDDTDLLTKMSSRDVECVASLANRLKSLMVQKEVEVVAFDDIERDKTYVQKASERLLQNGELYSLYRKIYLAKEEAIESNLKLCAKGEPTPLFADTKEQNGCCRVGQTKLFAKNVPTFHKHIQAVRTYWLKEAHHVYQEKREVDFHLHMISTVAGAEDLHQGKRGEYTHQDEIWMWVPSTEQAIAHLKSFFNNFRALPQLAATPVDIEFLGEHAKEFDEVVKESLLPVRKKQFSEHATLSMMVLRFKAGSINSRKAMISPYLPRLTSG